MDLTISAILFGICIYLVFQFVKYLYSYWERKGFPYIPPKFPYGNIQGLGYHEQFGLLLNRYYKILKGKGPVGGVYFLWRPFAVALDLDFVKRMLITDFQYFEDRGVYYNEKDDPLSAHLFAVDSEKWRPLRRKLTPTFTSGKMKFMYPTVLEVAENLKTNLAKQITNGDRDIEVYDLVGKFTTDVIGTCAFGIECKSLDNQNEQFRIMGRRSFSDRKHPLPILMVLSTIAPLARKLGLKATKEDVSNFFMNLISETVDYRESNNIQRNDFVDILINLKNDPEHTMSMNELSAQAFVFFIAGFDTSATTLSYALYELAHHKDIQQKIREEVKKVLTKHDGQFTYEAMTEMEYLSQTINETLRMHPPVGQLVRRVTKDYKIPNTNQILPKGMPILVPIYSFQHDPDIYADPEKFLPERFSSDNMEKRRNEAYLAFGDGPRNCIGMRFGLMQVKVALVTILQQYDVSACSKTEKEIQFCKQNVIMSPINGVWLNLRKLD